MQSIDNTHILDDYLSKLDEIITACGKPAGSKTPDEGRRREYGQTLLGLLISRDKIAGSLSKKDLSPEEIGRVVEADQKLKKHAHLIVRCVGADSFRRWSDAGLIPSSDAQPISWWWRLDGQVRDSLSLTFFRQVGKVTLWLVIAVSLSYVVEITRRFVGSGADAASVVTQGFLALLVGGTLVQFARQLIEGTSGKTAEGLFFNFKSLSIFAGALLLLLVALFAAQPYIAAYYSDLGVGQRRANNYAGAIRNLRRATELNPADALAHYNLGVAYQKTKDYDNAEAEYRAAIKWDRSQYWAYFELARLIMIRRNDYAEALRLAEEGLSILKNRNPGDGLNEDGVVRNRYGLLVVRGWAYLGLQLYRQAENSLNAAAGEAGRVKEGSDGGGQSLTGAEAFCLKGKLLDAEARGLQAGAKAKEAENKNKQALCAFLACRERINDDSAIEPDLFGLMQERLSADELPDCE